MTGQFDSGSFSAKPLVMIDGTTSLDATFGRWAKRSLILLLGILLIAVSAAIIIGVSKQVRQYDAFMRGGIIVALLVFQTARHWQGKYRRLVINETGIHYRSGLPASLQRWDGDWDADWKNIRNVDWMPARRTALSAIPAVGRVRIETVGASHVINAALWADGEDFPAWRKARKNIRRRTEWPNKTIMPSAADWADLPLVRALSGTRFAVSGQVPDLHPPVGFDLAKNTASHSALWVFFCAMAYAIIEFFIHRFQWLPEIPWPLITGIAIATLLASLPTLLSRRVPLAESLGLSILIGPCIAAACLFGALRINEWTSNAPISAEYLLVKSGELQAADTQLPSLRFPDDHEYWVEQKPGSTHSFKLYRGIFGFFQLDLTDYHAQIRPFYERRYGK